MAVDPQALARDTGQIAPPDPFANREAAIRRATAMAGLNPGGFSPMNDAIIKNAGNLITQLLIDAYQRGDQNILEKPAEALQALAGLIRRGIQGGKIFGGSSAEALPKIQAAAERGQAGSQDTGDTFAAAMLKDPTNTEAIFGQAKYGGLGATARAAATHALGSILDAYQRQVEGGGPAASNPAGLLSMLLGQPVKGFAMPGDYGAGAGAAGAPGVPGAEAGAATGGAAPMVPGPQVMQSPLAQQAPDPRLLAIGALGTPNPTLPMPGPPPLGLLPGMQPPQPPNIAGSRALGNLGLDQYINPY